jgi:small-conductance mechanosensitive channel
MKRTILKFGLSSGAIITVLMAATLPFQHKIGFDRALLVGYTTIVLAFLLVFFGIRSYRDNEGQGQITFARAFGVGISITLITCVCYVVTWEIIYFNFMHNFMDEYAAYMVHKAQSSGMSAAALQVQLESIRIAKQRYENIFYNSAMTFIEPFPVGFVITLVSAAVLRKAPAVRQALAGSSH